MVRKGDGTQEPFDLRKLRRSLAAAMAACQYDERFAESLAQAVLLHLTDWKDRRPPSTEYIFRCVREVLTETGLADVARQLCLHRRTRSQRRRGMTVVGGDGPGSARPWAKGAVCTALREAHGLTPSVARILAGEIETRVMALNYELISAGLVAELIQSELLAWGLAEGARLPAGGADRVAEDPAAGPAIGQFPEREL